jgi:hypothetical protein
MKSLHLFLYCLVNNAEKSFPLWYKTSGWRFSYVSYIALYPSFILFSYTADRIYFDSINSHLTLSCYFPD